MRYISTAYTIERVAEMLGEDVLFIEGIAGEMMPEDGRINIIGLNDEQTIAFTQAGIERLEQLIPEYRS